MNKLEDGCFSGHDTRIFIVQITVNIQIFPLVGGNFDSSRLQEGIFVYTLVNCTIK